MVLVQEYDSLQEHVIYYLIRGLFKPKLNYTHVEKLALAVIHTVQRFRHYILLCKTTIMVVVNPFQYVLTQRVIDGKISWCIIILQEFDLDFSSAKSNKYLVFVDLISKLSIESGNDLPEELVINDDLFFIASSDPWSGYILMYLHTLKCPPSTSSDEHRRIHHQE